MMSSTMSRSSAVPSSRHHMCRYIRKADKVKRVYVGGCRAAMGDSVTTVGKMEQQYTMPLGEIKAALEASIESTQRGLTVNSETRGEINELITQLESMSPNPNPTEAMELLAGSWKLTYTNDLKVIALLGLSRLPFITINDLTQSIIFDGANYTAENTVSVSVPFSQNSFSTRAALEVRSPKRLQLKLKQGTLSTPQLMTTLQLPDTVTIMGQNVDLKDLKNALAPVQSSASEIMGQVANLVKQQPDLEFPFPDIDQAQTWLLTTYLDNDTRIGRGDGGSVFVMQKEMLLAPTSVTDTAFVDDISEEIIDLS